MTDGVGNSKDISRGLAFFLYCIFIITLINPAFSRTIINGGSVSGQWNGEGSPYIVTGDIIVDSTATLEILENVDIQFDGEFSLTVYGYLFARGGHENRVQFRSVGFGRWRGIKFMPSADRRCILEYCTIQSTFIGVDCDYNSPDLFNNIINSSSIGIKCSRNSSPKIEHNEITIIGDISQNSYGIWLQNNCNSKIYDNKIEVLGGSTCTGIYIMSSICFINENWINIASSGVCNGIYISDSEKLDLEKNIVRVQSPSQMRGFYILESIGIQVINNNFHLIGSSSYAIGLDISNGSEVLLINNIILGNSSNSIGILTAVGQHPMVEGSGYNDLYRNYRNYVGGWQGEGTDIYLNPSFVMDWIDTASVDSAYFLIPEGPFASPCIDAGDPDIYDWGNNRSDIGRFYVWFDNINPEDNNLPYSIDLISLYPNPFNSTLSITINQNSNSFTSLIVYNLSGQRVDSILEDFLLIADHNYTWSPKGLSAGEYFLQLKSGKKTSTRRIMFLP